MKLALNPKNAVKVLLRLDNLLQVTGKDSPCLSVVIRSAGKWDSLIFDFLIGLVHYSVGCSLVVPNDRPSLSPCKNFYLIMIKQGSDGALSLTTIYQLGVKLIHCKW